MKINDEILCALFENADEKYKAFQYPLIPDIDPSDLIGVRTPVIRKLAAEFAKRDDINDFLSSLPHKYYDENNLHSSIICRTKDLDTCLSQVESFLPYIDNWATCDMTSPKAFAKNPEALLPHIRRWIASDKTYTVRFAVISLMRYFLDDKFSPEYPDMVAAIRSEEYYIKMGVAWYFATALTKQYTKAVKYIEERRLDKWTHNKAIQKAIESRLISDERKNFLRSLKIMRNA